MRITNHRIKWINPVPVEPDTGQSICPLMHEYEYWFPFICTHEQLPSPLDQSTLGCTKSEVREMAHIIRYRPVVLPPKNTHSLSMGMYLCRVTQNGLFL